MEEVDRVVESIRRDVSILRDDWQTFNEKFTRHDEQAREILRDVTVLKDCQIKNEQFQATMREAMTSVAATVTSVAQSHERTQAQLEQLTTASIDREKFYQRNISEKDKIEAQRLKNQALEAHAINKLRLKKYALWASIVGAIVVALGILEAVLT